MKKKNYLILKERENFLKRNIQDCQDLLTTLNTLEKKPKKIPLQVTKEKIIVLKVRENSKIEVIDLNNLPSKNTKKKEKNFKIF